jgi:eukaryotic translation initiation factor 2C
MSTTSVGSISKMDPKEQKRIRENLAESAKRSEMPWHAFGTLNDVVIDGIPERNALSNLGQKIPMKLNLYKLEVNLKGGSVNIYQYDIKIQDFTTRKDVEIRAMKKDAWEGPTVQNLLGKKGRWLFDGNAIAWSLEKRDQPIRIQLDLSAERGRQPSKEGSKQRVVFEMTFTRVISANPLKTMLDGSQTEKAIGWGELLNLFEHVIHQHPSQKMVIKNKSFYQKNELYIAQKVNDRTELGQGVYAVRGNYVSFKPVFMGVEGNKIIRSLALNVDVSNSPFWVPGKLIDLLPKHMDAPPNYQFAADAVRDIAEAKRRASSYVKGKTSEQRLQMAFYDTRFGRVLFKLKFVKAAWMHLKPEVKDGKPIPPIEKVIQDFVPMCPKDYFFLNDKGVKQSVQQYFLEKYQIKTMDLPMARFGSAEKPNYVPLECLRIVPDQIYKYQLSEQQTSNMLSFAVKPPPLRWQGIENVVKTLDWANDPWLKDYGMSVNPAPIEVNNARLLPCPSIVFNKSSHPPKITVSGRWRIDGKQFSAPNDQPIGVFGFAISTKGRYSPKKDDVVRFAKDFVRIYAGHGGRFVNPQAAQNPFIWEGDLTNAAKLIEFGKGIMQHCAATASGRTKPALCFFVVSDRDVEVYNSVKQACDLRWGCASQVLQSRHVAKCSPQYISNICLKVNAKLGGATCFAQGHPSVPKMINAPTAIIGADVTHGGVGSQADSIAAMTMSKDKNFAKYMGMVAANGKRQEIIQYEPIHEMMTKMIKVWTSTLKAFPTNIIYMRDGVSNQQFYKIVTEEVRDIKRCLRKYLDGLGKQTTPVPKFTVLCATKRHHTRLFPTQSQTHDQNRNPLPGTLVETGCTLATGVDWYLNSHVALKGTARPVHYVLLQNECAFKVETLQQFVFEHCFQYVRSTTPISQHPAIYYAHLAAARGIPHVEKPDKESDSKSKASASKSSDPREIHPLNPLQEALIPVMWYV